VQNPEKKTSIRRDLIGMKRTGGKLVKSKLRKSQKKYEKQNRWNKEK
jgi:hypothetical protein